MYIYIYMCIHINVYDARICRMYPVVYLALEGVTLSVNNSFRRHYSVLCLLIINLCV